MPLTYTQYYQLQQRINLLIRRKDTLVEQFNTLKPLLIRNRELLEQEKNTARQMEYLNDRSDMLNQMFRLRTMYDQAETMLQASIRLIKDYNEQ